MYHIFIIHSSVDGYLGCFLDLTIVNSATMNISVPASFWIIFSFQIFSQKCDCWIIWQIYFFFLRNLYTVHHSCCTKLHSLKICHSGIWTKHLEYTIKSLYSDMVRSEAILSSVHTCTSPFTSQLCCHYSSLTSQILCLYILNFCTLPPKKCSLLYTGSGVFYFRFLSL